MERNMHRRGITYIYIFIYSEHIIEFHREDGSKRRWWDRNTGERRLIREFETDREDQGRERMQRRCAEQFRIVEQIARLLTSRPFPSPARLLPVSR